MNPEKPEIPTSTLIMRGYLLVNIPTILIILAIWLPMWKVFLFNYLLSAFLGSFIGWIYWEFSIRSWVRWADAQGASEERILKIGRFGFLLWTKGTINRALKNET